jgi:type II secretory pathway pseudopilin PulG
VKKINFWRSGNAGFTLIEILIYAVIFGVSATFLVGILTTVTRSQLKQVSINDVNQQLNFVASTIQRLVRDSSLIENDAGVASSTLVLRTSSSSLDKTFIYSSGTAIYMEQGAAIRGGASPIVLTNDKVNVSNFSVTKYENAGGLAVVQVDLSLDYNTSNPQAQVTRSWRSAIARVTAATFDSSVLPNSNGSLDIGNNTKNWNNLYISGKIGVGTDVGTAKIKSNGDIGFTNSSQGLIFVAPNSSCFRVTLNANYQLATTSVGCP